MIKQKEICSTIFSSLSLLGTSHQLIQYLNSKMKTSHFIYGIMLTTIGILVTDNRYSKWHRAFRRPRENFNTVWTFLETLHISLLVIMLAFFWCARLGYFPRIAPAYSYFRNFAPCICQSEDFSPPVRRNTDRVDQDSLLHYFEAEFEQILRARHAFLKLSPQNTRWQT